MVPLIARRVILGLESRASASSRPFRAGPPSGTSREPTQPTPLPPSRSLATGCRGGRGPHPGWDHLGRPDLAVDEHAPHPAARRVRRLAVQNTHPGVAYVGDAACARCHRRSPKPTARTRWADRWRRSGGQEDRRSAPPRGSHSRRRACDTRGAPRRTDVPQGEPAGPGRKRVRRDRGRGPLRARLGDAGHHLPDRARWLPLPVADRLVRPEEALGYLARLRGGQPAAELRARDPARVPVLPHQQVRPWPGR